MAGLFSVQVYDVHVDADGVVVRRGAYAHDLLVEHVVRYVKFGQYARGGGRCVRGDEAKRMRRRYAARMRRGLHLLAQRCVELLGRRELGFGRRLYLALDPLRQLVQLPVFELRRKHLVGQGSLLAQYLQCETILVRTLRIRFRNIKRYACDDCFERL